MSTPTHKNDPHPSSSKNDPKPVESLKELGNANESLFLTTPKVVLTSQKTGKDNKVLQSDIKNPNLNLNIGETLGRVQPVSPIQNPNESENEEIKELMGFFDQNNSKSARLQKSGRKAAQGGFLEDLHNKTSNPKDPSQQEFKKKLQASLDGKGQQLKASFDTFREKSRVDDPSLSITDKMLSTTGVKNKSHFTKKNAPVHRMTINNETSINYGQGHSFMKNDAIPERMQPVAGSLAFLNQAENKLDNSRLDDTFHFWKKSNTPRPSLAILESMDAINDPLYAGRGIQGDTSFNNNQMSILKDLPPMRDIGHANMSFDQSLPQRKPLGANSRVLEEFMNPRQALNLSINQPMDTEHSFAHRGPYLYDLKNTGNKFVQNSQNTSFNLLDPMNPNPNHSGLNSFQQNMLQNPAFHASGPILPSDITNSMAGVSGSTTGDITSRIPANMLKKDYSKSKRNNNKIKGKLPNKFFEIKQNEANKNTPHAIIEENMEPTTRTYQSNNKTQQKHGNQQPIKSYDEKDIVVSSEAAGESSHLSDPLFDPNEVNFGKIARAATNSIPNNPLFQTLLNSKNNNQSITESFFKNPKYRYIWNRYTSQVFQDIVKAKCQEIVQRKSPEILEMINKVVSKNKKWKKVLRAIKEAAESNSSSSESETNVKNTLQIENNQEKSGMNITNNIRINFNTEIRFNKGNPFRYNRYKKRRRKLRRKKHIFCKKARKSADQGKSRAEMRDELRDKTSKSDSDSCDCSNLSDDQVQRKTIKRIKGEKNPEEEDDRFKSFISECPHKPEDPPKKEQETTRIVRVRQNPAEAESHNVTLGKRDNPMDPTKTHPSKFTRKKRGRKRKSNGRRRPGRPKKSRYLKMLEKTIRAGAVESEEETSYGTLSLVKRTVFDVLFNAFVKKLIPKLEHAEFLNSSKEEAIVVRNILKKKFILAEEIKAGSIKMIKPKKRNEEINKFVVKRCFKFLMKKERERSFKDLDNDSALKNPTEQPPASRTSLTQKSPIDHFTSGNQISKMNNKFESPSNMSSRRSVSPNQSTQSKFKPKSRGNRFFELNSQMQNKSGEGNKLFQETDSQLPKLFTAQSPVSDIKRNESQDIENILDQLGATPSKKPKKEEPKIVAHSKILSEHQFYNKYFGETAKLLNQDIAEYYLPNTKIANNAIKQGKYCHKTINIKYIKLILKSPKFMEAISLFLEKTFEQEYVSTRNDKLLLMSKNINDKKYIKSVKLPWTVHEIHDAKDTFTNIVESARKAQNIDSAKATPSKKTPSKKGRKRSKNKNRKSSTKTDPSVSGRSRTSRRRGRPRKNPEAENFQACFVDSNRSNKFLNK